MTLNFLEIYILIWVLIWVTIDILINTRAASSQSLKVLAALFQKYHGIGWVGRVAHILALLRKQFFFRSLTQFGLSRWRGFTWLQLICASLSWFFEWRVTLNLNFPVVNLRWQSTGTQRHLLLKTHHGLHCYITILSSIHRFPFLILNLIQFIILRIKAQRLYLLNVHWGIKSKVPWRYITVVEIT